MKTRPFLLLALSATLILAVAGAGCSTTMPSLPGSLRSTRYFENLSAPGDVRTVHQICREVLEKLGYKAVVARWSEGILEMNARVLPGSAAQLPVQRRVFVKVVPAEEGNSGIQIGFWEVSEDTTGGTAVAQTERLLKGGTAYDLFAERLQEAVTAKAAADQQQAKSQAQEPATPLPSAPPPLRQTGTATGTSSSSGNNAPQP